MNQPEYTLQQIAEAIDAQLIGDPNRIVRGIQTLEKAGPSDLAFLSNPLYQAQLDNAQAAAVILSPSDAERCSVDALVMDNPYLGYAQVSHWFDRKPESTGGVHTSAIVDPTADVNPSAAIGPNAVIGANTTIEKDVVIGANTVVEADCRIGSGSQLAANVSVYHESIIGERVIIHSAAVIGADGFGFAPNRQQWVKIAQIGRVVIGDDVEIGAGTTIDRGALGDTCIADGVKLDNQIQVAHNVEIGENTAIAGCVAIAGSTKIGRRCAIAGASNIVGHLTIADDVQVMANTLVTKSISSPGVYASGTGMMPHRKWKRNVVRFRQLDQLASRLSVLEKQFKNDE
ncbi:MAG: UDP-3-O-(3-hydroxymyristoyl)glucosamine N-acyltransferase [Motiliproteus sp.]|nr:UDP-3-O-(3-hydroxymyristoyl)glucosamine N-acyltransferase [Motiliproteus sp.]MCW9054068.1 UDP-3-O-(3-hydroxymyristoyl)glucosamine N-acyltransferase [Motiliproteus sp.]